MELREKGRRTSSLPLLQYPGSRASLFTGIAVAFSPFHAPRHVASYVAGLGSF
jgi:hypothetical protein